MISRRNFLKLTGQTSASLIISTSLTLNPSRIWANTPKSNSFTPNIYLEINSNNKIKLWVKKAEMGQHIHTALVQIAAEELNADINLISVIQAETGEIFKNIGTGGSYSVAGSWLPLRKIMAQASYMLTHAAADLWNIDVNKCIAFKSIIQNTNDLKTLNYGDLIEKANTIKAPENLPLKTENNYNYIGKNISRLDSDELIQGKSIFGTDIYLDEMFYATVIHPPLLTCKVLEIDYKSVEKIKGIVEIIDFGQYVAIVALNQWIAFKTKNLIKIKWDYATGEILNTNDLINRLDKALESDGVVCRESGKIPNANDNKHINAYYYMPLATHMPLEPPCATADVKVNKIQVWAPIQMASNAQSEIAKKMNLELNQVTIHTTLLGGSFGRKLERDFIQEAVAISAHMKKPVKLIWTRESDVKNGFFRPNSKHYLSANIDKNGMPRSIQIKAASPSVFQRDDPTQIKNGHDWSAVLGLKSFPYAVDNLKISHKIVHMPEIPITWWRGTYSNHNCFAIESFIDELANFSSIDSLDYRLKLLTQDTQVADFPGGTIKINHQKLKRVLLKSAEMIKWKSNKDPNIGYGIACHSYETNAYTAHAVKLSVDKNKNLQIIKIVCAFDIGIAVNPSSIKAQIEGSIVFALTSALYQDIKYENGQVKQSNFHDQPILRLSETPEIKTHIFSDGDFPGGVGECATPSVVPAIVNAIYDASGIRVRSLPINLQNIQQDGAVS